MQTENYPLPIPAATIEEHPGMLSFDQMTSEEKIELLHTQVRKLAADLAQATAARSCSLNGSVFYFGVGESSRGSN